MMRALDETADAHDDLREENEKTAGAFFKSAENVTAYEGALNDAQVAVVAAALAEGDQVRALELVIAYADSAEATIARLAAAEEEAAAAAEELAADGVTPLRNRVAELNANIEAGLDLLNRSTYEMEQLALATEDADRALLGWISSNNEAAMNTRFWEQEVDRIAAEEEALELLRERGQAFDDELRMRSKSQRIYHRNIQLAEDEAAAAAWRSRQLLTVNDLERMILGTRQASAAEAKDATKNVIALLRADRQVRMTEKAINQLLDERNELLGLGT